MAAVIRQRRGAGHALEHQAHACGRGKAARRGDLLHLDPLGHGQQLLGPLHAQVAEILVGRALQQPQE